MALLTAPCCALYSFEGFPLKTAAQGQVDGQVLQFTILGLQNSPRTLEFDVPDGATVQWARTYVGVWGGTPKYTGWVQVTVNSQDIGQVKLYGQDDKTQNVWCTGYGVYWTAWDMTEMVKNGHNTIKATTSQGLPESKLDGRIYGMTTVIVVKTHGGADTRYWILEGNTNLHGEGWTSGANPTINDETSATISVPDLSGNPHANLSIIELTSSRGLPDYVQFNGKDLGSPVTDMATYPAGAYDIADEMSYNNGYPGPEGKTIMGRYWDSEIFDVTSLVKPGNNEVKFLRGRDLNGDGTVSSTGDKPEGEDYLHPVFAMLTLERPGASSASSVPSPGTSGAGTDLAIGKLDVIDAFNGQTATLTATLQNLGTRPSDPVTVDFFVDGASVVSKQVTVDASGVQQITASWPALSGPHTVSASVQATGDRDTTNNVIKKEVTVGTLPDLSVSVSAPRRPGAATATQKSPVPVTVTVSAVLLSLGIPGILQQRRRNGMTKAVSILFILLITGAGLPVVVPPVAAADTTSLYLIMVTVNNAGGSDAAAFSVSIYLDGEKIATRTYDDGLGAGNEVKADIPIHTTSGSHSLRVVVDEAARIQDGDRSNNVAESTYVFP